MPLVREDAGAGTSTARLLVTTLFLATALFFAVMYGTNASTARYPWVNHDVGYHAYLGIEMARGERLYVDLKEDNPPGSPLLLGWVAGVGRAVGAPDFLALHLLPLTLGLAGLAVLWTALPDRRDDLSYGLVALAYLLVMVRGTFSNNLYPTNPDIPYDFGQREHIFSLLFVPYMILRAYRRKVPVAVYPFLLLLGFTSTFKPFWPPMIAIVELYRQRQRRPGWWVTPVVLGIGMTSPLLFLALHSVDSVIRFFGENIPMYLAGAYTYYDTSFAEFVDSTLHWQMIAGAALLLGAGVACLLRRAVEGRIVLLFFFVATFVYASVVYQNRFWSYHTMVFFAVTVVPAALLLAGLWRTLPSPTWRDAGATAVVLALSLGIVGTVRSTGKMLREIHPLGAELVPLIEPYDRSMFFSMSVATSYAPLLLRKEMVGSWTVFLYLPQTLAIEDEMERARLLEEFSEDVRRVIETERPDLLVFSPEGIALPEGMTMHGFFVDQGVVPHPGYRRILPLRLAQLDRRLANWPVYERIEDG